MENENKEINNTITFDSDGEKIEAEVLEQTVVENITYLLVSKKYSQDDSCYILKDVSCIDDTESIIEEVDDDKERDIVYNIFMNVLKDDSINLE